MKTLGTSISVTLIDSKTAFDTVICKILINKLQLFGVAGKLLRWFQSYLSNRKQCCKVNGKLSNLGEVTCGVLQGSCLGSLLFIIYINDLPLSIKHLSQYCILCVVIVYKAVVVVVKSFVICSACCLI